MALAGAGRAKRPLVVFAAETLFSVPDPPNQIVFVE